MLSNVKERDAETWIKGDKNSVPAGTDPAHACILSGRTRVLTLGAHHL